MRILIYEPMPDIRQVDVWLGLASEYARAGHELFMLVDEEVQLLNRNHITKPHTLSCLNIIRWKLADSGLPFYAVPRSKRLRKLFAKCASEERFEQIDDYRQTHYQQVLQAYQPNRILVWNGLKRYQQRFLNLVRQLLPGSEIHYLEAGWFPQAGTYYEDRDGVNAASSIARIKPKPLTPQEFQGIESWKQKYRSSFGNYRISDQGYYFVPLQLESDTNITLFSPFKTMEEFLHWVVANTDSSRTIIIRPHPLGDVSNSRLEKISPRIKINSTQSLQQLLAQAHAVIGINSTVLLESLIYNKPTFALGQGVFSSSEAIIIPSRETCISKRLEDAESISTSKMNSLLHYLANIQKPIPNLRIPSRIKLPKNNEPIQTKYSWPRKLASRIMVKTKSIIISLSNK